MVYNSIWSDTFYYTDKSPFTYTIRLDGEVIFAGRAYMFPDAEQTRVNINKVCENYLHQTELTTLDFIDPSDVSAITENPKVIRYFELWDEDEEALVETFCFLDCWDYDYHMSMYPMKVLSNPIDDTVRPWMGKFETKVFARLNDSEDKLVFAIDLNDIKDKLRDSYLNSMTVSLSNGSTTSSECFFYYTPQTDYLTFATNVGQSQHQYHVPNDFTRQWSNLNDDPISNQMHARVIENVMYLYSDEPWDRMTLKWQPQSGQYEEEYITATSGLSISPESSYIYFYDIPHTFEVKTVIYGIDDDDPRVTNQCIKYVLYYVNARGGWDSFCIQGSGLKKENITAYTTDRSYNNNTMEFEQMRNVTEIQTVYELNTHYLTDEQSENLVKNLLGSNLVYLHDFTDGVVRPVVIQDKAVTYQTYQTNGKKLAQYKITVAESQIKHRRH